MLRYAVYPSLQDKIVFITGGGSGIGAAMVRAFSEQGASVAFIDIDEDASDRLIDEITENGMAPPWYQICDVTDSDALKNAIDQAADELGSVTVLVNNVANDNRHSPTDMTPENWRRCMAVNLDAAFFSACQVQPMMREQQTGSIINIGSINAIWGPGNMAGYVTAKAGLMGMTKALARDFGKDNIRVNTVLPGWVKTEKQLKLWLSPETESAWKEQLCIKQLLEPEDVARLVLFLAADDSALITAQHYIIDCGKI